MTEQFLYLTTVGRTSGQPRQIEIWFTEHAGRYYVISEKREQSGWVKNLERDPSVSFSIGTRAQPAGTLPLHRATARILHAKADPALSMTVAALMSKKYDWSDGLIVELAPL